MTLAKKNRAQTTSATGKSCVRYLLTPFIIAKPSTVEIASRIARRPAPASGAELDDQPAHELDAGDEFADFERWDKGNLDGSEAKQRDMLQYEYARSGLLLGLKLQQQLQQEQKQKQ